MEIRGERARIRSDPIQNPPKPENIFFQRRFLFNGFLNAGINGNLFVWLILVLGSSKHFPKVFFSMMAIFRRVNFLSMNVNRCFVKER